MKDITKLKTYYLAHAIILMTSCGTPDERQQTTHKPPSSAFISPTNLTQPEKHPSASTDSPPPETVITAAPPLATNLTRATFSFTSPQADVSFECRLDAEVYTPCISPLTSTDLSEGMHLFSVRATDLQGNTDPSPAEHTWEVDLTPPTVTFISGPPILGNGVSATFQLASSDPRASYICRLDGMPPYTCSSFITIQFPLDGHGYHTLVVDAIDLAGNLSISPAIYMWTVDIAPPVITLLGGPDRVSNQTSATFLLSSEASAKYEYALDGGEFLSCANPIVLERLSAGSHQMDIRATDAAGNTSPALSYSWDILLTPPTTIIIYYPPAITNLRNVEFRMNSNTAGVTYKCRLDDSEFTLCSNSVIYSDLSEGTHAFQTSAVDLAGTEDPSPANYTWQVDITKPTTTILDTPPPLTNQQHATFRFFSSDDDATYECSLDFAPYAPCPNPCTYTTIPDGDHYFAVRAQDAAGNMDDTPSYQSWIIDHSSRTLFQSVPPTLTKFPSAIFTFLSTTSNILEYDCSLDNSEFSKCSTPFSIPALAEGSHTLRVRTSAPSTDTEYTLSEYSWVVDLTPPLPPEISQPSKNDSIHSQQITIAGSTEPNSQVIVYIDNLATGSMLSREGPWSFPSSSDLEPGQHILLATATDAADNISLASDPIYFTIEVQGYYGWGCAASSSLSPPSAWIAAAIFFRLLRIRSPRYRLNKRVDESNDLTVPSSRA